MDSKMKAGILAVAVVLFASLAMLAVPASDAEGTEPTQMTAEKFLEGLTEGKLVMSEDVALKDALKITTEMELDLAGHKLVNASTNATHTITVGNGGKLTVKDSVGNGIVDNITHGTAAVFVDVGGEATLNGGTFERSLEAGNINESGQYVDGKNSYYTILNHGKMTINSGVTVKNGDGVTTGAYSSIVSNGYYTPPEQADDVVMTINGGTFIGGKYVKNDDYGVMTINGGTFQKNFGGWAVYNVNTLTITDGVFESEYNAVFAYADDTADYESGKLTITGGKFTWGEKYRMIHIYSAATYTLDIAVEGISEGKTVLTAPSGSVLNGTVSVNKNAVAFEDIIAGTGFALSVGSIDISGAYTSTADGSITVNGDCKLSGTIDGSVTVKVESGSITVPAGKTLTGTIQMGEKNSVAVSGITAGENGLTVTPSTIGGGATAGSIAVGETVSVASALNLGKDVTVTIPEKSELSVPKGASISGEGTVSNEGTLKVDGAVQSHVDNTGTVSAAVDAEIPDVDGKGTISQPKPTIVKKTFDKEVTLGETVILYVDVTKGADLKITGVTGATYKDGAIYWTPTVVDEWKITATPYIGDNIGESVTFTINVTAAPEPVDPIEPEKKETGGFSAATILIIVLLIALGIFAVTRVI